MRSQNEIIEEIERLKRFNRLQFVDKKTKQRIKDVISGLNWAVGEYEQLLKSLNIHEYSDYY